MGIDVAIIGGSGVGSRLATLGGKLVAIPTEYGWLRGRILQHEGVELLIVQRHSAGHKTPPHAVNYRAISAGLRALGVRGCLSSAAVGCLRPDWPVGTFAVCSDFLDLTGRRQTMHSRAVVHTDFSSPFDPGLRASLLETAAGLGLDAQPSAVYLCGDGPRYETPAEIAMMRTLGADVVGMTASTEAILLREAGVPYACLAVVTNAAAGMAGQPLSHEEVIEVMERRGEDAVRLLLATAGSVAARQ